MSENNLENLFESLEEGFDVYSPNEGHEKRFLRKLNSSQKLVDNKAKTTIQLWKPLAGIAATVLIVFTFYIGNNKMDNSGDLASVSPKMAETQDFFTLTINEELNNLKLLASPEVDNLIKDTLIQIKKLENEYNNLKVDLIESGDDNRVIYAMISNFQNRIVILQNTLEQINKVKQLKKSSNHETNITI